MCGIVGFWEQRQTSNGMRSQETLQVMNDSLAHRGPDDQGIWVDEQAGIALGHRRLSILELSPLGSQPMVSECGRFVIVYNGEVYNHYSIRGELKSEGVNFRGNSDTETLLHSISQWGVETTLEKANGMFAFGLWDRRKKNLTLARDRIGIKPLYYGTQNGRLFFASELKAIRKHPEFKRQIDRRALKLLFTHNYIPCPFSIEKSIRKLPPGAFVEIDESNLNQDLPTPQRYWNLKEVAEIGQRHHFSGTKNEAKLRLRELISDSVRMRTLSDVSLGAFLSGGIDSSLVVALLQEGSTSPIKTFTIGFHEKSHNEAGYAKAVANHLRTDHTEHYVSPEEARDVIPNLPVMFDEPFSDASQIPTFLVSQLARKHVTVSLSGDGGDELFCGYERYHHIHSIWNRLKSIPARASLAKIFHGIGKATESLGIGLKFLKRASQIGIDNPQQLYQKLHRHWRDSDNLVVGTPVAISLFEDSPQWANVVDHRQQWMWLDSATYLPDDILTKVDRASMAVGLEARVPLLDHRIVEFAWSLPAEMNFGDNDGKRLLKSLLYDHVPRKLVERPKVGFGVPIHEWLRGPLRDWAEALLDESRLAEEGFLNPKPVRLKWGQHVAKDADWQYHLWDVLMFQAWLEANQ